MKVGYARVSTKEQNIERQIRLLTETYNTEKIYQEKESGKDTLRPELQKMLEFVRSGDIVIIESYSRLARSTSDFLMLMDKLNEKGVHIISNKENIDTSTPAGKLAMTVFAGLYQFERECLLERQKEGIRIAKEKGLYKGRKPAKYDKEQFAIIYEKWRIREEITAIEGMKKLGMSASTFYRRVKEYEEMIGVIKEDE